MRTIGKNQTILSSPKIVMVHRARTAMHREHDLPMPYMMISSYGIPLRYPSIAASPILAEKVEMTAASEINERMTSEPLVTFIM